MYKVRYYTSAVESKTDTKEFDTYEEAIKFLISLRNDTLWEMKKHEDSNYHGSTLRCKE
jgi:hypothetical protein